MANLVSEREKYITRILNNSLDNWETLPEVEKEFDDLHVLDQQDLLVDEWPMQEQFLDYLAEAHQFKEMNPEQEQRYQALLKLVEKNRPIVERIYADAYSNN